MKTINQLKEEIERLKEKWKPISQGLIYATHWDTKEAQLQTRQEDLKAFEKLIDIIADKLEKQDKLNAKEGVFIVELRTQMNKLMKGDK